MASSSTSPRRHYPAKFVAIICSVVINPAQSFSYYFPGVGEAVLRESGQVEHVHVLRHRGARLLYSTQGRSSDADSPPRESTLKATSCSRTELLNAAGWVVVAASGLGISQAAEVLAPEESFVDFVDSRGLFSCQIPYNFLRRERAKDKSGTLFVAGDYNKAEIMSVQLLTTYDLLTDAGLPTIGDMTTWESLGKPRLVAELLKQRRDADAAGGAPVESVVLPGVSIDGDVLKFTLKSPIKVMRLDLLEKDRGVSELYRNTLVKAIMRGDGSFLVLWAGALNTDWEQEGGARDRLRKVVESFHLEGLVVDGVRLGSV